jgi:hypothetical protein
LIFIFYLWLETFDYEDIIFCEILGSHSSVAEDSSLLGCDAVVGCVVANIIL